MSNLDKEKRKYFNKEFHHFLESGAYSILALFCMWLWMNSNLSLGAEAKFIRFFSTVRASLFSGHEAEDTTMKANTWFINAESEGLLINRSNGLGNMRIVDRSKLDTLLQLLNSYPNPNRIIICDLVFDTPLKQDSSLALTLKNTPSFFWPKQPDGISPTLLRSVPGQNTGYADYTNTNDWWLLSGKLVKFPLQTDRKKSLPLAVYDFMTSQNSISGNGLLWFNYGLRSNMIYIDETVRQYDLSHQAVNPVLPIQIAINTLKDHDEFTRDFTKKNFVVIGDFKNDIHETSLGPTAGALINFNIICTLLNGNDQLTGLWLIFMVISLTAIIHYSLYGRDIAKMAELKATFLRFSGLTLGSIITLGFWMIILSIISYIRFHVSLEVIPCSTIISIIFYFRRCVINYKMLKTNDYESRWHKLAFVLFHRSDIPLNPNAI